MWILMTKQEAIDRELVSDIIRVKGWDPWIGFMPRSLPEDTIELTEQEAIEIGLLKGED